MPNLGIFNKEKTESGPVVAIDIGNTHVHVGWYAQKKWRVLEKWPAKPTDSALWRQKFLSMGWTEPEEPACVVFCSVNPDVTAAVVKAVQAVWQLPVREIRSPGYGMTVQYEPASALGSDRFANALGAWRKWQEDVIVIDIGTAITIDWVQASGIFAGGFIGSGPHLLAQCLSCHTAQLPLIASDSLGHNLSPGHTTHDALEAGIALTTQGFLKEGVAQLRHAAGSQVPVVFTGGGAEPFWKNWPEAARYAPLLTLEGLLSAGCQQDDSKD
ncbi:MAG: type III pantothenate kinase [Firmicutes bacterium]|nr:type III pantothenate kinase [Bacillota bacterium]